LLKGLEASEHQTNVYLRDNRDFRLDAEYFSKQNIGLLNTLESKKHAQLGDFCYVTDGIHESIDYCEESRVNLFSATTPRENFFDLSRKAYISVDAHLANPRTALLENDIVISTVGTIGNCAVINKTVLPANSDRHVGILRLTSNAVRPRYVSTFLLTKYGRFQTWRESTGNVQLNLFLYRIRTLKIALPSIPYQQVIEDTILKADRKHEASKSSYAQAEALLLETLGLTQFTPSIESINIKSFKDSFGTSGRMDAEYYQPKYEALLDVLKRDSLTIADVATVRNERFKPQTKGHFDYIEIGSLNGDGTVTAESIVFMRM
jgi:Type I restriction modification DNA specificity domain